MGEQKGRLGPGSATLIHLQARERSTVVKEEVDRQLPESQHLTRGQQLENREMEDKELQLEDRQMEDKEQQLDDREMKDKELHASLSEKRDNLN